MSKISNCLKMLELLSSGRIYSTKELSERLEVKSRMIRFYKDEIEKAGVYISTVRGPYGGYYIDYDYNTPVRGITKDDVAYLKDQYKDDKRLSEITSKLETIVVNDKLIFLNDIEKDLYNKLSDCIINSLKVAIVYKSTKGSIRKRIIHPSSLYNNSGIWRVMAYCEYKEDIRRFRLSSIIKLEILKEIF